MKFLNSGMTNHKKKQYEEPLIEPKPTSKGAIKNFAFREIKNSR